MSALDDLRARLMHHRSARKDLYDKRSDAIGLAVNGDLATATELADDIELAMHPALAAGGEGGAGAVLGLYTIDTTANISEGVNTTIDFNGEAPNRDTLGITWNVGAEGFEVAEDGVYAINAYAGIDGLNWDAEFPTTILSIVHDASEPNVRSRSYGGNVDLHCALTIPLAEGETFRAAVQYITDAVDPTHDVVVLLQVTRVGDIPEAP